MKAAVGIVVSFPEEIVLVLAFCAFLLGTCRYESKVFERRLAEDKFVFSTCDRLTGKVVLDLGLVNEVGHSGLGLWRVGDTGETTLIVLDRCLKGDNKVSGIGVDKVGGNGDTMLMLFDRALRD